MKQQFLHHCQRAFLWMVGTVGVTSFASAQLVKQGYYRIQNANTNRYIYVMDDKGSIDYASTSADMGAILTFNGFEKAVSDPSTIIYMANVSGGYSLEGQGTSTWSIIQYPIQLMVSRKDANNYWCYASKSGVTLYLDDEEESADFEEGCLGTTRNKTRDWRILPVETNSENYFGVQPTLQVGDKYYASFYVSFPFSFASEGMKAYTVSKQNGAMAVLTEVTSKVIPASTPVIIECSSADASNNRLNIGGEATALKGNLLKGNFFNYYERFAPHYHTNRQEVNTNTMRTLGVDKEGKLAFVTPSEPYLAANTAYFELNEDGLAPEVAFVTDEEFDRLSAISVPKATDDKQSGGYYRLDGTFAGYDANHLSNGVYLHNGQKTYIRK